MLKTIDACSAAVLLLTASVGARRRDRADRKDFQVFKDVADQRASATRSSRSSTT